MKRIAIRSLLFASFTLLAGMALPLGAAPAAPTATASRPLREVILVFKTHFDIGYTDLASNVVQRYRTTMIDDALRVVDQNRNLPPEQQFAWTLPGWPMNKIAEDWAGQTPERKARIQAALQQGRFAVHALPFTTHTELLELEDLVRGLGYASRLARGAGLELPRDAKMTDVPCHAWIMPTLLRHAGVAFLHLGCNAASSSPRVPRLFFWEGPDGSRLLTFYAAEGYGSGLMPPKDWPYATWLALIHTGDNHGPPRPEEVGKLLAEARQKLTGVTVRIGRLSDFADAVLAEKAEIPVVRGDMPDTWIHGPLCDPAGAALARTVRPALAMTEALNTLLKAWHLPAPDAATTIARAYEQSLLYGEHTWGGALYWVTRYGSGTQWGYGETWKADHAAQRFQRLEASWAEHTAYIETARALVQPLEQQQLAALGSTVPESSGNSNPRLLVYNPLPWSRSGLVYAPRSEALSTSGPAAGAGRPGEVRHFLAGPTPGMACSTADLQANPPRECRVDTNTATLETALFKAVLDPARGAIRSLVHRPSGRELVDRTAPYGFGQFLYERFDSNQVAAYVRAYVKINADWAINELGKPSLPPASQVPYRAATPQPSTVGYDTRTATGATAWMTSPPTADLPMGITTRLTLYADQPYADLEVEIRGKPADPWPEAGWICLPFKIDAPQFRLGRLGSIIDPAHDIVPGANRHLLGINTGVALFGADGAGAGVCSLDSPLVSLDTPGCWKYSLDFVPKRPAVYVNVFSNQWTTNFRLWNEGTWTFRVRVWAFDRYEAESALITPSLEARFPLVGTVVKGDELKRVPDASAGLSLSRRGVLVTALGANPDGPGTVLRLWELAGQAGPVTVRLPSGLSVESVHPVNLRGQPQGEPLPVAAGAFTARLGAFAPASFVLR